MEQPKKKQSDKNQNYDLVRFYNEIHTALVRIKRAMDQGRSDQAAWTKLIGIYEPAFRIWIGKRISRYDLSFRKMLSGDDLLQEAMMGIFDKRNSFFYRCDCFNDPNACPEAFTKWAQTVVRSRVYDRVRKTLRQIYMPQKADPKKEVEMIVKTVEALLADFEIDFAAAERAYFEARLSETYKGWFKNCPVIVDAESFEREINDEVKRIIEDLSESSDQGSKWMNAGQLQAIISRIDEGELTNDIAVIVKLRKKTGGMIIPLDDWKGQYSDEGTDPFSLDANREAALDRLHRCMNEVIANRSLPVEKVIFWLAYCFDLLKEPDRNEADIRKAVYQKSKSKKLGRMADQIKNDDSVALNLTEAQYDLLCERLMQILIKQPVSEAERDEKIFDLTQESIGKIVNQCEKIEDSRCAFTTWIDRDGEEMIPKDVLRLLQFISLPCYETQRDGTEATISKSVEKNSKTTLTVNQNASEAVERQLNLLERTIREIKKIKRLLKSDQQSAITEDFFRYPDITKKEKHAYTLEECLEDDHAKWSRWIGTVNRSLTKRR